MKHNSSQREIDTLAAEIREMLELVRFDSPGENKKNARCGQRERATILREPSPHARPHLQVDAEGDVYQSIEKNIDMPRARQQPQFLWNDVFIREIGTHVAARDRKDHEQSKP